MGTTGWGCAENIRKVIIALRGRTGRAIVLSAVYPLILLVIGHNYRGGLSVKRSSTNDQQINRTSVFACEGLSSEMEDAS